VQTIIDCGSDYTRGCYLDAIDFKLLFFSFFLSILGSLQIFGHPFQAEKARTSPLFEAFEVSVFSRSKQSAHLKLSCAIFKQIKNIFSKHFKKLIVTPNQNLFHSSFFSPDCYKCKECY